MTGNQVSKTNMDRQQRDLEWSDSGAILLMSCYELGHQPMSLALPMGILHNKGFSPLANDIAVDRLDYERAERARVNGQRMSDLRCEGDERRVPRLTEPWFC